MQTGNIIANSTTNGNTVISTFFLNNSMTPINDATRTSDIMTVGNVRIYPQTGPFINTQTVQSSIGFNGGYIQLQSNVLASTGNIGPVTFLGNYTIEGWINTTNATGIQTIIDTRPTGTSTFTGGYCNLYLNSGSLSFNTPGGLMVSNTGVGPSSWYHVAISRSNYNTLMFINGVQVASVVDSSNYITTSTRPGPIIGVDASVLNTNYFIGNIADFRISQTARYTTNFAPPNGPLPLQ
jgi:hypothetical protein